ncbi:MAG: hypothetical protein WDA20_09495 [Desulfuromonadales bacterium]
MLLRESLTIVYTVSVYSTMDFLLPYNLPVGNYKKPGISVIYREFYGNKSLPCAGCNARRAGLHAFGQEALVGDPHRFLPARPMLPPEDDPRQKENAAGQRMLTGRRSKIFIWISRPFPLAD